MSTIIKKDTFAPARTLIERNLKRVMRADIKIASGAQADNGVVPPDKQLCIMEATAYILGYEEISDAPPCTSAQIRGFMISINDADFMTDRKRAQLKKVIPEIVNTAPTVWKNRRREFWDKEKDQWAYRVVPVLETSSSPEYTSAENQRRDMIRNIRAHAEERLQITELYGDWADMLITDHSMSYILDFIREMAAVAKFDGAAEPPK